MQPVLDRLGLDLVQAQLATERHDVLVQVKLLHAHAGAWRSG